MESKKTTAIAGKGKPMDKQSIVLLTVAGVVVLAGVGVALYFMLRQKKVNSPLMSGGLTRVIDTSIPSSPSAPDSSAPSNTDTASQQAYDIANYGTTGQVPSTWSQVETSFDSMYNYQKRDGIWWTAKKSDPTNWVSLADPKWATAVTSLNAAYPND